MQRASLALAQQLCTSRRACTSLLEGGAANPLAAMLLSAGHDTEVCSAVLECVSSLSEVGFQQVQTAVRNVGAVPCLIQLMNHHEQRVSGTAAQLVSTLCPGDVQSADQLFESGGLVMLADRLAAHGDERSQLQAVSALSQLSADPQQASAIVENGCLTPLLELLEHPNQATAARPILGSQTPVRKPGPY